MENSASVQQSGLNMIRMKHSGGNTVRMKHSGGNKVRMKHSGENRGGNRVRMKQSGGNNARVKQSGGNRVRMKHSGENRDGVYIPGELWNGFAPDGSLFGHRCSTSFFYAGRKTYFAFYSGAAAVYRPKRYVPFSDFSI